MIRTLQFLAFFVPAFFSLHAKGQGWEFDSERTQLGKFALGVASGVVAHEFGHFVVATSKGYKVGNDGFSLVYPGAAFTDSDHLQVASAGFQTQWLLSELILHDSNRNEQKEPPGDFGAGIVCAHLAITAAYLFYLKDHYQGDIVGIAEATGYSNNQIALALAIPGVLDAWRLFGNQVPDWVPQLSVASKSLGMAWVWTY